MGDIGDGTKGCTCDECHKLYRRSVASLHCTPETAITLYGNCTGIKIKTVEKRKWMGFGFNKIWLETGLH